jgi:hypothetical protein
MKGARVRIMEGKVEVRRSLVVDMESMMKGAGMGMERWAIYCIRCDPWRVQKRWQRQS